jgi:hypothetical protein
MPPAQALWLAAYPLGLTIFWEGTFTDQSSPNRQTA